MADSVSVGSQLLQPKDAAQVAQKNGASREYSQGVTPADLAARFNLKPQTANSETEYHGANFLQAGAEKDGFILNADGTAYDRKIARRYTSREVETLSGLARDEYEPCREYSQRNGHAHGATNGHSAPQLSPKPKASPAPESAPKTPLSLEARGLTAETLKTFGVQRVKGSEQNRDGWKYPTHHADGTQGRQRFKNARAKGGDELKYQWWKGGDGRQPDGYNLQNVPDGAPEVWIVGGEVDVWIMAQNGFRAVCAFGETQGAALLIAALTAKNVGTVNIALDNDTAGRAGAQELARECQKQGVGFSLCRFDGFDGFDVCDAFSQSGRDEMRFRKLMLTLPEMEVESEAPEAASTRDEKPAFEFSFTTDSDLDERLGEIEWLWDSYIPRGFITGIVADQDQGKSTVAQNFCDTVLRGTRWPDGTPHTPQPETKLLWIDTEGSIALFHQRAKAWKMPRGRFILPPDPLQELTVDDFEHWAWIEAAIEKFQPPLVVIDALSGAHKSGKENGNDEMKLVMKKLAGLAQRFNIAVLVVHHLNKPAPAVASYPISIHRLRGASAISQYCRSIIALGTPDVNQPENRRLDVIKLNLKTKPESVGYQLTDIGPVWGAAPEVPKQRRAIDDALDFLEIAMQSGARLASDVQEEAKAHKIGGNALRDARKVLKIKPLREGGKDGRWFWHPENSEVTV